MSKCRRKTAAGSASTASWPFDVRATTVAIQTRGDANNVTDPGWIVLKGDQYRTVARLPYLGWVVNFRAANGAEILLGAIALVGALSLLQRFWHASAR